MTDAPQSLQGRVAVVTGASRGIGAAIAQRLASAGATVVLAARGVEASADGLPGTVTEVARLIAGRGGRAVPMACDVEDDDSRAALVARVVGELGRLDILVNNAGRAVLDRVEDMTLAMARSQAEQYLFAPLDLSLHALSPMKAQGEGWIVNLGSDSALPIDVAALVKTQAGRTLALYGALKAAVHRASAGFAVGLYADNIAVNVVSPVGAIATPGVEALGLVTPQAQPYFERVEHIAEAALALVSRPPRDQTGVVAFSYRYLDQIGRSTMSLDGREVVQARTPPPDGAPV
jgi:3-oxoacyl-[acyl-carrier protein] reductase